MTEKRIAVVSILVSDRSESEKVNGLLSEYGEYILGRMGIPYREKSVSVLSVVLEDRQCCRQSSVWKNLNMANA